MTRPGAARVVPVVALVAITASWWRVAALRRAVVVLVVAFALLGAVFVSTSAFTPTATVDAEKTFGRYQNITVTQVEVGALAPGTIERARAALAAAVPGAHLSLHGAPLAPDSNPPAYFYESSFPPVVVIEDPAAQDGFPGRYHLDSGRWPCAAGEVALSPAQYDALPDKNSFTAMSGQVTLRVVGVVTDAQQRHDRVVITGPGTFESLTQRPPARRAQSADYQLQVLWGPRATGQDVGAALAPFLPPSPDFAASQATGALPAPDSDPELSTAFTAAQIAASTSSRAQSANALQGPAFGSDRFVVSYLPLVLVALLVAAFAAASIRSAQRGDAERLVAIGLRRPAVTATRVVATTAAGAIGVAIGLAAGWGIAAALRATVLYRLADQPLSPIPTPSPALLGIAVATVALLAVATTWPQRRPGPRRAPRPGGAMAPLAWARRALAIALVVAAYRAGGGVYSVLASYLLIAAVLTAAPDALAAAVAALPRARARMMVTAAMMRADARRQATALVVVAACIAVPICAGTQLVSRAASDNTFGSAGVPAGQLWVQGQDPAQDVDGAASAVTATPGLAAPIIIQQPRSSEDYQDPAFLSASFTLQQATGSASFAIMVVDSADQLRRLLGPVLPASAEKTLADGGVIDFTRTRGKQSFTITGAGENPTTTITATLPTARIRPDKAWRLNYGGVVLRSTAQRLGLPVNSKKSYYFTDVTQPQTTAAVAAAVAAGYDAAFVQYHVEPFPQRVPPAAYVFLAALVAGAFTVLLLVVGGQAVRLRAYSARLVAIGLTPRWTRGILATQAALTVGLGLAAGTLAGLAGVRITADHYARLVIPTTPITIAVVATVLAATAAISLAARRLSATERHEVT